jgi:tight adherence protein B
VLLAAAVAWVLTGPAPGLGRLAGRVGDRTAGRSRPAGQEGLGPGRSTIPPERDRGEETALRLRRPWPTGLGSPPEWERGDMTALRLRRPGRVRRAGRRSQAELTASLGELLTGLSSGLVTGASPREVLADAAADLAGLDDLAATARSPTGDLPRALERLGRRPGGAAAVDLAVLWRLAERTGCSLVGPVQRMRDADRGEAAVRRELAAQLAGPRATARLLAGLPVLGVVMAAGLGADPLGFLLGTAAGAGCLALGGVLVGLGLLWTRMIVRSVEPGRSRSREGFGAG